MFLDLDRKAGSSIAAHDNEGRKISFGELCTFSEEFGITLGERTLIFILSENSIGSLAGYVASLSEKIVPLLLSSNIDHLLLLNLINIYHPAYIWLPDRLSGGLDFCRQFEKYDYVLLKTCLSQFGLFENLSLLLPTSGSTGSPKLVRHSYSNVEENARNVASFFELDTSERPIASLPMHYTMGLSVITSHLYAGCQILLVKNNLTDKAFWEFIRANKATSFTGVPYSYEILHKLRFFRMELPDLKLLTQGGGKLSHKLFREFAEFAEKTGRKFIATYGQTEGTARMAYLPSELALTKTGSIGRAIPNGELSLIDINGNDIIDIEAEGEMVYRGPNVTLGYAQCGEDLIKDDENKGVLFTGDIAKRDSDGCYYIVGRMSRFLKLYGNRISLDESEQLIKSAFNIDCYCSGNDDVMKIYLTDESKKLPVLDYIIEKTGLFHKAIEICIIDEIRRNEAGKVVL